MSRSGGRKEAGVKKKHACVHTLLALSSALGWRRATHSDGRWEETAAPVERARRHALALQIRARSAGSTVQTQAHECIVMEKNVYTRPLVR